MCQFPIFLAIITIGKAYELADSLMIFHFKKLFNFRSYPIDLLDSILILLMLYLIV